MLVELMSRPRNAARRGLTAGALAVICGCTAQEGTRQAEQAAAEPPLRTPDCVPCRLRLPEAGGVLELRFVTDSASGGSRRLRALRAKAQGLPESVLPLSEPVTLARGDSVVIDVVSLGRNARALAVTTEPGAVNSPTAYWLLTQPPTKLVALGQFVGLVTGADGRICSYERGGQGGIEFQRTELSLANDSLRAVRRWSIEAAASNDRFLEKRTTWRDATPHVDSAHTLTRAEAEGRARDAGGACP